MHYREKLACIWNDESVAYDKNLDKNLIASYMRRDSLSVLDGYFKPDMNILEIGCGTGTEAVALAKRNINITAIDVSPEMIRTASVKARKERVEKKIDFAVLSADDMEKIAGRKYDGAYSSFGVLNCVEDMEKFGLSLSKMVRKEGYFICSVMNKYCLAEIFYFLLKLSPEKVFRRMIKQPVPVKLSRSDFKVDCRYYSLKEFTKYFKNDFSVEKVYALSLFLLPYFGKIRKDMYKFFTFDKYLSGKYPFNMLGDHFLVIMKRR